MFNMSNKRFIGRSILAVFFCLIGLASYGEKIPTNEIHYTTVDNSVLPLEKEYIDIEDGCPFLSNSYNPEKNVCILKFDKDVTEIGGSAFRGCSSLTSISIPSSVTEIGYNAFDGCSSLTSISIPSSVTEIGDDAFASCSSLTSISIPSSVTEIGDYAFLGCSSLTSISIPSSVTEIGGCAFRGCSSLTSISVSKDNKFYDSREDCNAIIHTESNTLISGCKNTIIPSSVTRIEGDAFRGCSSLTSISIPSSVTEIWGCAFDGCSSLTNISIPSSVTEIGYNAFRGCSSLMEVRIPKGCQVSYDAFKDCPEGLVITRY